MLHPFSPVEMHAPGLALLMLLAANGAPVLAAMVCGNRWAWPLDGGMRLRDGLPLFGAHKTWRGLCTGVAAGGAVTALLGLPAALGATFGFVSLAGDAGWSFVKRRLRVAPGRELWVLDALAESLLPVLLFQRELSLGAREVLLTIVGFAVLDVVTAGLRR